MTIVEPYRREKQSRLDRRLHNKSRGATPIPLETKFANLTVNIVYKNNISEVFNIDTSPYICVHLSYNYPKTMYLSGQSFDEIKCNISQKHPKRYDEIIVEYSHEQNTINLALIPLISIL